MSGLGEEERYPQGLTERCELLELLSENSRGETLLVRERDSGRLLVAKCRQKAGVDFDAGEAEILRRLGGPGCPCWQAHTRARPCTVSCGSTFTGRPWTRLPGVG